MSESQPSASYHKTSILSTTLPFPRALSRRFAASVSDKNLDLEKACGNVTQEPMAYFPIYVFSWDNKGLTVYGFKHRFLSCAF